MTMNQMNPTPVNPAPTSPKEKSGMGPIMAIIVIVALLALGGIYYLMTETGELAIESETLPTMEEVQNSDDPDVQAALSQSTSDEVAAIEADLEATDFSGIDEGMAGLDAEVAQ